MDESEKRGPIEKGKQGWPINPIGVIALAIISLIAIFLIAKPLSSKPSPTIINEQQNASGGQLISPQAGEIIKTEKMLVELSVENPNDVEKVQFWAKTYSDGKWEMIGEIKTSPYKLNWQIPTSFQNKAVAITSHIYTKSGEIIKDPGGWREGIIILSQ